MNTPKNMVIRNGRHYARLQVPKDLRAIIGKRELTAALGADRHQAIRDHAAIMATMQAELDAARTHLAATIRPRASVAKRRQSRSTSELRADDAARMAPAIPGFNPAVHAEEFRPAYRAALTRVAAGHATDDETAATIGWAVAGFTGPGNLKAIHGTADWRALARSLSSIQLEVLRRQDERDQGD
jgi:hypothetical protein